MTTEQLRRSWLVQRLDRPRGAAEGQLGGLLNAFSFGGGLRNGGLRPEAMELLSPLMSFHYMGSAEFEFGEVPRTFQRIAERSEAGDMAATTFTVKTRDVEPDWDSRIKGKRGRASWPKAEGETELVLLCPPAWAREAEKRVRAWAGGDHNLKAGHGVNTTLRPSKEWHDETGGWLELDNGFMFFADRKMADGVCDLMGVDRA